MHVNLQQLLDDASLEKDFFKLAIIIKKLRDDWEYPLSKISRTIKKHPSYISSLLRVNNLPEIVKDGFYSGQISESHLLVLARLNNQEDIIEAYKEILKNGYNLTDTHILIRKYLYNVYDTGVVPDIEKLQKFERELQDLLQAKVKIFQSRVTGKITIEKKGEVREIFSFLEEIVNKIKKMKM